MIVRNDGAFSFILQIFQPLGARRGAPPCLCYEVGSLHRWLPPYVYRKTLRIAFNLMVQVFQPWGGVAVHPRVKAKQGRQQNQTVRALACYPSYCMARNYFEARKNRSRSKSLSA